MDETIIFNGEKHKGFFESCVERADAQNDPYRRALFYALGICEETRKHINAFYDFDEKCINFDALSAPWQTSGTRRICRLAFNLFNGFHYSPLPRGSNTWETLEPDTDGDFTPYELFAAPEAGYMLEAVKIRYPEYTHLERDSFEIDN